MVIQGNPLTSRDTTSVRLINHVEPFKGALRYQGLVPSRQCRHAGSTAATTRAAPVEKDSGLADGWAVEVSGSNNAAPNSTKPPARRSKAASQGALPASSRSNVKGTAKTGRNRSPFLDMTSEQGMLGLTMLQQRLKRAEMGREGGLNIEDTQELIDSLPQLTKKAAYKKKGIPLPSSSPRAPPPSKRKVLVYEDDDGNTWEEEEDEDITDKPSFELNLDDQKLAYVEYDSRGKVISRTEGAGGSLVGTDNDFEDDEFQDDDDDDDYDGFDFSEVAESGNGSNWTRLSSASRSKLGSMEEDDLVETAEMKALPPAPVRLDPVVSALPGVRKARAAALAGGKNKAKREEAGLKAAREVEELLGNGGVEGASAGLLDDDELEDWGLDELSPRARVIKVDGEADGSQPRRRTLMQELGISRDKGSRPRGVDEDLGITVAWGGSASTFATDLEEQERLLSKMFKPHKVAQFMEHQRAALKEAEALRRGGSARGNESRLHRQLRIVSGSAAGKRLLSSQGAQTRPMMEKVRQAIFNMLQSQAGTVNCLPSTSRWLDLFAGTGSVGLEALSRGCREAHFIEMDPWVTRNVLGKNIATCSFQRQSIVHTTKAEDFLRKAIDLPRFAGGAFDFISMCPPYLLVSYPELFDLLNRSQLVHEGTLLFVEYPKQLTQEIPDTVAGLVQVRNRKYGRTHIVVYGSPDRIDSEAAAEADDGF